MLSTLKSKYETVSKNEFSLNGAIQAMAIELTNIAAKRQLISVSEFRPIPDIIFVFVFSACKFAVQTSGSLIWIDGCERFLDRKCYYLHRQGRINQYLSYSKTENVITALKKTFLIDETRKKYYVKRGNQEQEHYKQSLSCL